MQLHQLAEHLFVFIPIIPTFIMLIFLWRQRDPISTKRATLLALFFVPLMGAASIFYSIIAEFNVLAIILGVILFIIEWIYIFRSARFHRLWQSKPFKRAFILNSVLRMCVSHYLDIYIFYGLILILQHEDVTRMNHAFLPTLGLTLTHGLLVQMVYALSLAICYAIVRTATRLLTTQKEHHA